MKVKNSGVIMQTEFFIQTLQPQMDIPLIVLVDG